MLDAYPAQQLTSSVLLAEAERAAITRQRGTANDNIQRSLSGGVYTLNMLGYFIATIAASAEKDLVQLFVGCARDMHALQAIADRFLPQNKRRLLKFVVDPTSFPDFHVEETNQG